MLHAPISDNKIGGGRRRAEPMASAAHRPSPIEPYGNQATLRIGVHRAPSMPLRPSRTGIVQRQCACGGDSDRAAGNGLTIGEPGDAFEQEADRVAEQVMRMPDAPANAASAPRTLRRTCAACDEEERSKLHAKRQSAESGPASAPPIVHEVLRSPGQPLDEATRGFMEPRFGVDFSRVRVHADARASESARAVDALAYTVGRDVVFGAGQYLPRTSVGRQLLAHELTHVVQQAGSDTHERPAAISHARLQRQYSNPPKDIPAGTGAADLAKVVDLLQGKRDPATLLSLVNLCAKKVSPVPDGCTKDAVDGLKEFLKSAPKNPCAGLPGFVVGKGAFAGLCCDSVVQNHDHCCGIDRINVIVNQCCAQNQKYDAASGQCVTVCPPGVQPTIMGTCPSPEPPQPGDYPEPDPDEKVA